MRYFLRDMAVMFYDLIISIVMTLIIIAILGGVYIMTTPQQIGF